MNSSSPEHAPAIGSALEGRERLRLCKDGQCSCGYIFTADGEAYIAEVLSLQEGGPDPVCGEALRGAYKRLFQEAPRLLAVAEWIANHGQLGRRGWSGHMPLAQWSAIRALVAPFSRPDQSGRQADAAQVTADTSGRNP